MTTKKNTEIILMGDLNINYLDNTELRRTDNLSVFLNTSMIRQSAIMFIL